MRRGVPVVGSVQEGECFLLATTLNSHSTLPFSLFPLHPFSTFSTLLYLSGLSRSIHSLFSFLPLTFSKRSTSNTCLICRLIPEKVLVPSKFILQSFGREAAGLFANSSTFSSSLSFRGTRQGRAMFTIGRRPERRGFRRKWPTPRSRLERISFS